ncbi:MAG TPA: hypothetical protein VN684_09290, partial [Terriglobales bacterium]|nr:hypothetical protein [Terriglobales bacterium]
MTLLFSSVALTAQEPEEGVHAPDGGTFERINSIRILPIPNAPFSGTITAEWTRTLEDGTSVTTTNHRTVMRDSLGRIFQERRTFVPKNGAEQPKVFRFEISDPATHIRRVCYPASHVCEVTSNFAPTKVSVQPVGPLDKNGDRVLTREDLGQNSMSGLDVIGTLETTTISIGVIGNDRPVSITKEFWYSPKLGLNLSVKRVDPRSGTETFTISDISLAEPDPKYFAVPTEFAVNDHWTG